jgi:hypothetical protein
MPLRTPTNTQLTSSYTLLPSSIETIDYALYNFITGMNISVTTNNGFDKVPVIFSIPERAYQVKNDSELRPNGRTLLYPLIAINKNSVTQNPTNKGIYGVNIPPYFDYYKRGGSIPIVRQIKQDKTQKFANANAIRKSDGGMNANRQTFPGENPDVVYETLLIPMPTWIEVVYSVDIVSEYHQQMNSILSAFHTISGDPSVFKISHEGNSYEAFIDPSYTIDHKANGLDTTERIFSTTVQVKVLGYLIGAEENQKTPIAVKRQNPVKIRFSRERSMLGEEPDFHAGRKDKFRP